MPNLDILLVGPTGNTHIAGSLHRAAEALGLRCRLIDTSAAYRGPRFARSAAWHLAGRRPLRLNAFSIALEALCASTRPQLLITMGQAPIAAQTIARLVGRGTICLNFSTDDPWNPAHRAGWHLAGLQHYRAIFTPRQANVSNFHDAGCRQAHYLPFAYDPHLFQLDETNLAGSDAAAAPNLLFVGGADDDRRSFMRNLRNEGVEPTLVGAYWDRHADTAKLTLGQMQAAKLSQATARAAVNLCLVRRANRDGHVMRSFEIPAVGGFMIAEDTAEHREIFGPEGECVLYFAGPIEAAAKTKWALAHPDDRRRMAKECHRRITSGAHTYGDRLQTMLEAIR